MAAWLVRQLRSSNATTRDDLGPGDLNSGPYFFGGPSIVIRRDGVGQLPGRHDCADKWTHFGEQSRVYSRER